MALPFRRRILLGSPLPAAWMSNVVIHNVYVKFYTDVVGLDTKYVGWVYLVFNIWNLVNDPIFGIWLDKLRYRPGKGKFVRVMRRCVPFLVLGLAVMAWTPSTWSQGAIFAVFLAELFLYDVASTLFMISATSYVYLAAPTREDRIDVEVVRSWIANISSTVATVVATQLLVGGAVTDRMTMNLLIMGVVLVNGAIYVVVTRLLKDPPELYEKGDAGQQQVTGRQLLDDLRSVVRMRGFWALFFHALTFLAPMGIYFTAYLYMMDHVIRSTGTQATVADVGSMVIVLLLLPLSAKLIKHVGSRTALWVAAVPYLAGLCLLFVATQWYHVLGCYVLIQSGRYMVTTASVALDAALIDDNERRTGIRKAGTIGSLRALMSAPLAGIQMVIFMGIITAGGYTSGADVQSGSAMDAIRFAAAGVPILFALVGMIPLLFIPYDKKSEAELSRWSEQRRAGDDGADETAAGR